VEGKEQRDPEGGYITTILAPIVDAPSTGRTGRKNRKVEQEGRPGRKTRKEEKGRIATRPHGWKRIENEAPTDKEKKGSKEGVRDATLRCGEGHLENRQQTRRKEVKGSEGRGGRKEHRHGDNSRTG
jgi:hypothetical protein